MKLCLECNKLLNKPTDRYRSKCNSCRSKKYSTKINDNKRENYDSSKKQVYYQQNKEKIKLRTKKRHYKERKENILYKLTDDIRNRTSKALKRDNFKKTTKFAEYIGCSVQDLKNYIEKQFQPEMTWQNRKAWHIDHIIPLSSAKTIEKLYELCHYTNLQPLWALDNIKKGNRYQFPTGS